MSQPLDLLTLSEPELIALRDLLDQLIPLVAACEQGGADVPLFLGNGAAAAIITISTEVQP